MKLFHGGFELFSGGFVGVDLFFVISGYLITKILIEDLENDRFSIINFYERRARGILPALFFVMLVCIQRLILARNRLLCLAITQRISDSVHNYLCSCGTVIVGSLKQNALSYFFYFVSSARGCNLPVTNS